VRRVESIDGGAFFAGHTTNPESSSGASTLENSEGLKAVWWRIV